MLTPVAVKSFITCRTERRAKTSTIRVSCWKRTGVLVLSDAVMLASLAALSAGMDDGS